MPPFVHRNANLGADLAKESPYLEMLQDTAEAVAEASQDVAPVDDGDYRDGIEATTAEVDGEPVGRVNATDWKSHWIEWGSANNQPHAPLRRGVLAAGLDFEEHGA